MDRITARCLTDPVLLSSEHNHIPKACRPRRQRDYEAAAGIKIPSDACLVACDQASVHRRREGFDFSEQV